MPSSRTPAPQRYGHQDLARHGRGQHRSRLGEKSYDHQAGNHSVKEFVNGMAHTNGVESVWAVIKRGYYGTYHHWNFKHMKRYIDEYVFRLNEGNVERDTLDRMASLCSSAMQDKRLTYADLKGAV